MPQTRQTEIMLEVVLLLHVPRKRATFALFVSEHVVESPFSIGGSAGLSVFSHARSCTVIPKTTTSRDGIGHRKNTYLYEYTARAGTWSVTARVTAAENIAQMKQPPVSGGTQYYVTG